MDHAIGGNFDSPVASDPAQGDIVFLVDTASETSVLSLAFSPTAGPLDTDTVLNTMGDPTFMENNLFLDRNAEILLLDSNDETVAILARDTAPNDEHIVYFSMVTDPGRKDYNFWVGLDMYDADEYENILTSIDEDIDVQRNDIFDVFGPDEILDAIENGSATPTEEPTGEATEQATEEPTEEATEEPTESATEEATEPATRRANRVRHRGTNGRKHRRRDHPAVPGNPDRSGLARCHRDRHGTGDTEWHTAGG